ncbi:MAG: pyridoxamine 5'-phosphate oxidase family protein [Pseudomonadota bacterium]
MKNKAMEARLADEIRAFIGSRRSLQLATLGEDGVPFASYAPFAFDENNLYVLLSDIAVHGKNLLRNPGASTLIIEDEDTAEELYARVRVNYSVAAMELAVGSPGWDAAVDLLEARHGDRPRKLSQLADFRLFRLTPTRGRYVKGFGKAYSLAGGTLAAQAIDHLREGHRKREAAA